MSFSHIHSAVSEHERRDLCGLQGHLQERGYFLNPIQGGKDPKSPHGEVFRVTNSACGSVVGIMKYSEANTPTKLEEDLHFSLAHGIHVPETYIFGVGEKASLILQPVIPGKSFEGMSDHEYHFILETLPGIRQQILALMHVFEKTFPTDDQPLSRYPDPSGNRAKGYMMRHWMNCLITPGQGGSSDGQKVVNALKTLSPKMCMVDTGWAIHQTTQARFTQDGIMTHKHFGEYLTRIQKDKADIISVHNGKKHTGKPFIPNQGRLGYLNPTHIATFALQPKYAKDMIVGQDGILHVFRPQNRPTPEKDGHGHHYVGIIDVRGSHEERKMPQYSLQLPVSVENREIVPIAKASELFSSVHPGADYNLGSFLSEQYGEIPDHVTHFVLKLRPEVHNNILTF